MCYGIRLPSSPSVYAGFSEYDAHTSMNPAVLGSAKSEEMGAMEMVAVLFPWRSMENIGRRSVGTTVGEILICR